MVSSLKKEVVLLCAFENGSGMMGFGDMLDSKTCHFFKGLT